MKHVLILRLLNIPLFAALAGCLVMIASQTIRAPEEAPSGDVVAASGDESTPSSADPTEEPDQTAGTLSEVSDPEEPEPSEGISPELLAQAVKDAEMDVANREDLTTTTPTDFSEATLPVESGSDRPPLTEPALATSPAVAEPPTDEPLTDEAVSDIVNSVKSVVDTLESGVGGLDVLGPRVADFEQTFDSKDANPGASIRSGVSQAEEPQVEQAASTMQSETPVEPEVATQTTSVSRAKTTGERLPLVDLRVPPDQLRITNPIQNRHTVNFLLDRQVRRLLPGQTTIVHRSTTIRFDRGRSSSNDRVKQALALGQGYAFRIDHDGWALAATNTE